MSDDEDGPVIEVLDVRDVVMALFLRNRGGRIHADIKGLKISKQAAVQLLRMAADQLEARAVSEEN